MASSIVNHRLRLELIKAINSQKIKDIQLNELPSQAVFLALGTKGVNIDILEQINKAQPISYYVKSGGPRFIHNDIYKQNSIQIYDWAYRHQWDVHNNGMSLAMAVNYKNDIECLEWIAMHTHSQLKCKLTDDNKINLWLIRSQYC